MTPKPESQSELGSWKEIASYLNITVRTAQKWEAGRGLPVKRLFKTGGRVSALSTELDSWRESNQAFVRRNSMLIRLPKWVVVVVSLVAVTLLGGNWLSRSRKHPATARFEKNAMVVLDASGAELWRKTFEAELAPALDGAGEPSDSAPRIWTEDLNGDGVEEVLFRCNFKHLEAGPGCLVCYSANGIEKWRFVPGRTVQTRAEKFESVFVIRELETISAVPHGPKRIVVTASHSVFYPAQVVLLSEHGEILHEYWHSGHLNRVVVSDVDADGKPEIYLGGTSNSANQATVIVLDPENFGGASDESARPDYQLLGFSPATVRARILLPRTHLNRDMSLRNCSNELQIAGGHLLVCTRETDERPYGSAYYEFDKSLKLVNVDLPDAYVVSHKFLTAKGLIHWPVSMAEEEELRKGVTYLKQ
jgi:hypothetical protein